ncbi:uncharacterized protein [Dermacentor albipictus]|uniref:uncharacterized protein n=1 Tax=Dermacentor albipictus TaxID=60249 RepID=UPI0038FBFD98
MQASIANTGRERSICDALVWMLLEWRWRTCCQGHPLLKTGLPGTPPTLKSTPLAWCRHSSARELPYASHIFHEKYPPSVQKKTKERFPRDPPHLRSSLNLFILPSGCFAELYVWSRRTFSKVVVDVPPSLRMRQLREASSVAGDGVSCACD